MQISSAALQKLGHKTVTFTKHALPSSWFPTSLFAHSPTEESLRSFDAILLQYDNTETAKKIRNLRKPVFIFYGDHQIKKHGPLRPGMDTTFDPTRCMAQNIAEATARLFLTDPSSLNNGLIPPSELQFRKYPKRVAIHPISTSPEKNWKKEGFIQLKNKLQSEGWDPVFVVPPEEATSWDSPHLPTLADLAAFLYESGFFIGNDSGPGHLASNVGLPTLTIGPSKKHLDFWRPGWGNGKIVHPPRWVNYFKLTRKNWMNFVSVNKVFKIFNTLK
jgi:ADP-heptose:LPS heptosyltransferase